MYVRVKKVRGRRYAYLVEGKREGNRVIQRVVCYLGPMSRIANGLPPNVIGSRKIKRIDWKDVNDAVRRVPLTFEELSEARRRGFAVYAGAKRQGFLSDGLRNRAEGEAAALSLMAAANFRRMFLETGQGRYRMK